MKKNTNKQSNQKTHSNGKPVSESKTTMTEIVLPSHTNQLGTIFGGQIMAWIDIAGAIAATRHARSVCVTASIDTLNFVAGARTGDAVIFQASVNYAHKTSMEVGVRVESENGLTGERKHIATAYLTFVALDEKLKPRAVPAIIPQTPEEKRRYEHAQIRRESRLKLKQKLKR